MAEEKMNMDVEEIVDHSTQYRKEGNYEEARRIDQEGYEKCVLEYGEKDPNTLRVLHFLAIDYENLGRLDKAIELYQKMYDAKRTTIGSEHKETLNILVALSSLFSKLQQHDKAVEIDEKIYEIRKRNLGPEHLDTLSALNNVAYDYRQLGQFDNAKELDRRVYMKRKQLLGEEDPKTLSSAKHLAYDYGMLEDYENAIKIQEELCRVLKEKLEPNNPLLLESLTNLSTFYYETKKHEEARNVDEEIYNTQKLVLPEDDEDLLLTQENLAYDYHQLNDFEQAQTMDLSLLEIKKATLGEDHEETILKMDHLAEDYFELGDYENAFELDHILFEKYPAIKGEDKTFKKIVDRLVVECDKLNQDDLGSQYIAKQLELADQSDEGHIELLRQSITKLIIAKDYENAIKASQDLLEIDRDTFGMFSKETVEDRYAYIQLLEEASRFEEAAKEYGILFDLFERNRGGDHEDTLIAQEDLARAYIHAGMMQPAEATLRNLYARRLRLLGENDEKTLLIKSVLDKLQGEPKVEEASVQETPVQETPVEPVVEEPEEDKDAQFLKKVKQYYETCLKESGPDHKQTLRAKAFYACVLDDEKETTELLKDVYQRRGKLIFHIGHFDQEELDKRKEAQALWKVKNYAQALTAFKELKQMNQLLPQLHPDAVYTDMWYAKVLGQEGNTEEQVELLKSIYERSKIVGLDKHEDLLPVLDALANAAFEKKNYVESMQLHRDLYGRLLHMKGADDLQTIYYEHLLAKDYTEASYGFRNAELYGKDAYERLKRIAGRDNEITTLVGLTLVEIYQKFNEKRDAEDILSELSTSLGEMSTHNPVLLERFHDLQNKVNQMKEDKPQGSTVAVQETPVEQKPVEPVVKEEPVVEEASVTPVVEDSEEVPVVEEAPVTPVVEDLTDEAPVVEEELIQPVVEELFTDIPRVPETSLPPIADNTLSRIPVLEEPIIKEESIEEVVQPESTPQVEETEQFFYDPKFEEAKGYYVSGSYMDADRALDILTKSYETIYGLEDVRTLDALYLYGLTLARVGKLLDAKRVFEKVFDSRKKVLGDVHEDTIHAERELSKICQRTGFNTLASMLAQDIFDKLNKK